MLEIDNLNAFYGDAQALWGVSMEVGAGETVAVIGPNGAGKTTLVQCIAGMHRGRRGRITVDGVDVHALPAHKVCSYGVATVPEGRRVFPTMTVFDNLCVGAYRRAARATHRAELDRVHQLFPRLAQRAGQLAGSLSGGEQQMLAIGRALMARPRLLLLDEPSLGLAPRVAAQIVGLLRDLRERTGLTVLLVEQNARSALSVADRGVVLSLGRVVAAETPEVLAGDDQLRHAYLGF